MTNYFTQKFH